MKNPLFHKVLQKCVLNYYQPEKMRYVERNFRFLVFVTSSKITMLVLVTLILHL